MTPARHVVLFAVCCLAGGVASVWVGPFMGWDLLNYHYYAGYALLHDRYDTDYLAAQVQTFINPLLNVPTYLALRTFPPVVAGFLLGAVHGLNAYLLLLVGLWLGTRLCPELPRPARLAGAGGLALLAMLSPVALHEHGTTMNDNVVTIPLLLALYLLLRSTEPGVRPVPWVLAAGFLGGAAAGLKLAMAPAALGLSVFPVLLHDGRRRFAALGGWSLGGAAGFLAAYGSWMTHLWRNYGSPVFPFFNEVFRSPLYPAYHGGDSRYLVRSASELVALPFQWVVSHAGHLERAFRDGRYALLTVLLALVLGATVYRVARHRAGRPARPGHPGQARLALAFAAFALLHVLSWARVSGYLRYLVLLELLAPCIVFTWLVYLVRRPRAAGAATFLLLAGLAWWQVVPDTARGRWERSWFTVDIPDLPEPASSLVVLFGEGGHAYLFPFFDPGVAFVRFHTPLQRGNGLARLDEEQRERIARHDGPVYLMSTLLRDEQLTRAARSLELRPAGTPPRPIASNVEKAPLYLYRLAPAT